MAGGLQASNVPKNENLAEWRPAKPVDSVEKYQSRHRIETGGQIAFFFFQKHTAELLNNQCAVNLCEQ